MATGGKFEVMARKLSLVLALASLVGAMILASGCGKNGGAATDGGKDGGKIEKGKAQVLLFTTPT